MKKLLTEFLQDLLHEARVKAVRVSQDGQRIVYFKSAETFKIAQEKPGEAGVTYRAYNAQTDSHLKQGKDTATTPAPTRGEKPKQVVDKPTPEPEKQIISAPEGAENLNATSLANQIKNGIVSPGNDFSRYSESVSIFIAKSIIDAPDMSDQDIMERIIKTDCGSKTLTADVGVSSIPKRLKKRYDDLKKTGVFDTCPASESQNKARFMTMVVAETKANRMRAAIERSGLQSVSVDTFSGDTASRQRLRSTIEAIPAGAKIYTEDGELTKEEALERIAGFGTAKFPADTALLGRDTSGNLILLGFSDKKDLSAIINNSSVTKEVEQTRVVLDKLLQDGMVSEDDHRRLVTVLDEQTEEYTALEDKLQDVVTEPARILAEDTSDEQLKKFVRSAKTASGGDDPEKYWKRVSGFQTAAAAAASRKGGATDAQEEKYIKWLRMADPSWDGKSEVSDTHAMKAWALKCQHILSGNDIDPKTGEPRDLPKPDQELLFRLEVIPKKQIVEQAAAIKNDAMKCLETVRDALNILQVGGTPLGTYMDGVRAWHALHLDMADHKGSLSMVAEDNVVDYHAIQDCLGGISDSKSFIGDLDIQTRDIVSKDYGVVTGRSVEVFSIGKGGKKRSGVGVRSIRSKDGILGRLQTTWTYHPDFRDCLESKSK